ncbi:MAG: hypothetical protein QW244_00745 [Candidatus Pacearchaeota archaeon]
MKLKEALTELRKTKRNFVQTIELVVNLKNFDFKRQNVNFYLELPNGKGKDTKVALILEEETKEFAGICDVLTFNSISQLDIKSFKKLAEKYDYFITLAKLVPLLAKNFGKVLGPMKKMPDPKLGLILTAVNIEKIKQLVEKLKRVVKVVNDKNSIKIAIGKESMNDNELEQNANAAINEIIKNLPDGEANIKKILIKFTMSKPIAIEKIK